LLSILRFKLRNIQMNDITNDNFNDTSDIDMNKNSNIQSDVNTTQQISPFDYPTSLRDIRWLWRCHLQDQRISQRKHIQSILQCYQNNFNINNNIGYKIPKYQFLSSNTLKFGCPMHDLMMILKQYGFTQLPFAAFCNNHSTFCKQLQNAFSTLFLNNENMINNCRTINNYHKIGEWSFQELGICFKDSSSQSSIPIKITVDNRLPFFIHICRYADGVFSKRFRPGLFEYNGDIVKNQKSKKQKLGSWNGGKLFYVLENDIVILPIVENEIYFEVILDSQSKHIAIDHICNIVGGIGLSTYSADNEICVTKENNYCQSQNVIYNSIMLRCKEDEILNVLSSCKIRLFARNNSYVINVNGCSIMPQPSNDSQYFFHIPSNQKNEPQSTNMTTRFAPNVKLLNSFSSCNNNYVENMKVDPTNKNANSFNDREMVHCHSDKVFDCCVDSNYNFDNQHKNKIVCNNNFGNYGNCNYHGCFSVDCAQNANDNNDQSYSCWDSQRRIFDPKNLSLFNINTMHNTNVFPNISSYIQPSVNCNSNWNSQFERRYEPELCHFHKTVEKTCHCRSNFKSTIPQNLLVNCNSSNNNINNFL